MMLTGYVQASEPGILKVWIGLFDAVPPPEPQVFIDRRLATPLAPPDIRPIRDLTVDAGNNPVNHQTVLSFKVEKASRPHQIRIEAGGQSHEFATMTLPEEVPTVLEGSFNILLSSCYSQPEDRSGLLGTVVSQIKVQPHLTVLAGDQVYLDLPLGEMVPAANPDRARALSQKYRKNWLSGALAVPGLQAVLERAPVICIPDDHEFWNNYPFAQKQLPDTWLEPSRQLLGDVARSLYEDYQIGGPPGGAGGARRLDVDPLRMLFIDLRCDRDNQLDTLMSASASAALTQWKDDLIAARKANRPAVGMLVSGQALYVNAPVAEWRKHSIDAEMPNYKQFSAIEQTIAELSGEGIPVVYMTGDVHWGRVALGTDVRTGAVLYEVIASPSRLLRVPLLDTAKEQWNKAKGIFGDKDDWPRHSEPEEPPHFFGPNGCIRVGATGCQQRGDQVAIVSFTRVGSGADMQVSYYGISDDKALAHSNQSQRFELRMRDPV
ncbi:hypothetical protein BYI23_D015630 (plasmid) [Burkholderia sp. YI23]|uniref:alkaline phosphatase D family protein n=1 Tax=unclassified Caballeronia TaxID=2646786 RepID=UPI0002388B70|nr:MULTISPECIES: alkaline phosphatase D family protein [unclassified Caballeronia]AET95073.1 hypothetical protein BYI23_D015630 [Burkholderia sp. YI23]MCE4547607.1 alkaline phosphatase D family protein [Caballeronia sp. PC1]MCE4575065.1 alkaline phosphatase D family protein [Caballeronia sp. CLC5]